MRHYLLPAVSRKQVFHSSMMCRDIEADKTQSQIKRYSYFLYRLSYVTTILEIIITKLMNLYISL